MPSILPGNERQITAPDRVEGLTRSPEPMTDTLTETASSSRLPDDVLEAAMEKHQKFDRLVWYARKAPADCEEYWAGVSEEIKHGALNSVARIEEHFPDECDELRGPDGAWTHGFNSGMLAALRWILDACCQDELDGVPIGGLEFAEENFPSLDT